MKKKLIIVIGVIVGIFLIMCVIRASNKKKHAREAETATETVASTESSTMADLDTTEAPQDSYKQSLGIGNEDDSGRVEVERDTESATATEAEPIQTEPTFDILVNNFTHTEVPVKNMDGSSCKNYQSKVTLSDFGSYWGSKLTDEDFIGHKKYLVGVEQDNVTAEKGDLQSVGWLIDNLNAEKFQSNDAIKFTNLHIIGSLADDHVALLCSYDWYSAFGLDDTLVVFEDISGTLKASNFKDGDVFSATVFVHNCKVEENVAGQRVVCVQYATFDDISEEATEVKMNEDAQSHMQH